MLFSGDAIKAKGVPGSLMTERKEKTGRVSVSAQFKMEPGETAYDEDGREINVGGQVLTWYSTITDKTRARTIESMVLAGLPENVAEKMIIMAEAGKCGKTSLPQFGTQVVALKCKIDDYDGKERTKIEWVNSPTGLYGKRAQAEELDFGDIAPSSAPTQSRDADDPYA